MDNDRTADDLTADGRADHSTDGQTDGPTDGNAARTSRRRALSAATAVGVGAFATLFRPGTAEAADGDPIRVGRINAGSRRTILRSTAPINLDVVASDKGIGVRVQSGEGNAVDVTSSGGNGLVSNTSGGTAVSGQSSWGTGVSARSGFGYALVATCDLGHGALIASRNTAVEARSNATAVLATAIAGRGNVPVAVDAVAEDGIALQTVGRLVVDRSGIVEIPAGQRIVSIPVRGGVLAEALVFAQFRSNPDSLAVRAARPDPAAGAVVISLDRDAPRPVWLSWLVIG